MLQISQGAVSRAQKVVLYGVEGIGKSTLASQTPDPLFIDVEGGTTQLSVKRTQTPSTWPELLDIVQAVAQTPACCETLVIDTADWAEPLCVDYVCSKNNKKSIEDFGYGKGYTYLAEEFKNLLAKCDQVIQSGKHVLILAHAKQRKVELPDEMGAYDAWGLKLSKNVAPILKEWADALLFANYKTYVIDDGNGKRKAQGARRVIYANHAAVWDAKNRHGLPDEMDMTYANIAPIFGQARPAPVQAQAPAEAAPAGTLDDETLKKLEHMMAQAGIEDKELRSFVAAKGHFPFDLPISEYPQKYADEFLMPNWDRIADMIIADPNHLPF